MRLKNRLKHLFPTGMGDFKEDSEHHDENPHDCKKKRSSIPKTGEINPDEPCIASRPWNF